MELIELLRSVEMFEGLTDKQIMKIEGISDEQVLRPGETLFKQFDKADRLYWVKSGFIEVIVDYSTSTGGVVIRNLGKGQSVGEMSWVDRGARSATARAITHDTIVVSISFNALDDLCQRNPKIGYRIFRNIAVDLSFRLRQDIKTDGDRMTSGNL